MSTMLITGASRGIGAELARAFSQYGYRVVLNYNKSKEKALALSKEIGALCLQADVADFSAVKNMFETVRGLFGGVDVLINNAGVALPQGVIQDVSEEQFDSVVQTNLKGVFNCTKCAVDDMVCSGYGRIINISSVWGQIGGSCEAVYSMSKAGVIGFTKAMAKELAPSGITVNAIAPGFIDTDMNKHLSLSDINDFTGEIPLGRRGKPSDISGLALFLASDKASYITGQVVGINGGLC